MKISKFPSPNHIIECIRITRTEISTKRLILRPWVETDIDRVTELLQDPEISKMTGNIPYPYARSDAEKWIKKPQEGLALAITLVDEVIGNISLIINPPQSRAILGYWIGKEYRNHGYCTEALEAIIQYAFKHMKLHKLIASHFLFNPASGRVMEKSGMEKEALLRSHFKRDGEYLDLIQYCKINKD